MTLRARLAPLVLAVLAAPLLAAGAAHAKSWCAYPLWVHEWGVHVFDAAGRTAAASGLMPDFVHQSVPGTAPSASILGPAVRDLPPDGGERDLPVLQFYSPRPSAVIPLGLEVGFAGGPASAWYPQVDLYRSAAEANGTAGRVRPQLAWNRLDLTSAAARPAVPSTTAWVNNLRQLPALWVGARAESERFVYYEAQTHEAMPLRLTRGSTYGPGRRHYELHNDGPQAVHDVFVVQRDAGHRYVFFAPAIPAHASAGFLIEEHEVAGAAEREATVARLRATLVDPAQPAPPTQYDWDLDHCVMGRDPAVPFEHADDHRLYAAEVDVILKVWGERFFGHPGTTIVYREDPATLDAAMPLSVYTDMYNFVVLRRAGLALWEGVKLP